MPAPNRRRPLFAVALLLIVAAGCGSGSDDQPQAGATTSAALSSTTSAALETTTLPAGAATTANPATTGAPAVTTTAGPGPSTTPAPTVPPTTVPPTTVRVRTPVAGFGQIAYRIEGTPAQRCALLAETDVQHARGLMGRTDLAGYDGMLFVFPTNSTDAFWMKDTIMPLSIAWFRTDGALVSTADMTPCVTATCPVYPAAGPYRYALEVQQGGLGALGIGAGAVISIGGACA